MPKLNIDGTRINISDDFLKLSPEEQDAFVKNTIIPSPEFKAAQQKTAQPAQPAQQPPGALSEFGKAINPLEIGKEIGRTASENLAGIEGAMGRGSKGPIEGLLSTGGAAMSAAQLPFAIPIGALRNIIGHGMTGLEHLAGTAINPQAASLDDLGKMYEASRGDVDKALMAVRPAGGPVRMPGLPRGPAPETPLGGPRFGEIAPERQAYEYVPPPEPPPQAQPTTPRIEKQQASLETLQAAERQGITVPRVLTTDNRLNQQLGQILSKQPIAGGTIIGRAIEDVPKQLGEARTAIADQAGEYRTPGNVANDIREHIRGAAETETQAAEAAARQADEAARANWERTNQAREQTIGDYEAQSARQTGQQVGDVPPANMGDAIIDTVRANHEVARNRKDAAYREAGNIDATVLDQANGSLYDSILAGLRSDMGGQGTVDTTAAAAKAARGMLGKIRRFSNDARQRVAGAIDEAVKGGGTVEDAAETGQSMRRIEQLRQDLNFHASGADNPADQRAASRIIDAFDRWHNRAVENSLMEGSDPAALPAMRAARDANRDYRERFGYNGRNDADTILNKIVQPGNQIGPNDIAKTLTGTPDKAARLLDSIYAATADHPNHQNVVQAVRGGFWNKLAGSVEGVNRTPTDIQKSIYQFTRGQGQRLANRIYSPQDQALMQRHADVLAAAQRAREQTATLAKANEPVPTEVPKGPMQELADRVLGRGQKSDEALYNTIEGYAKSKGKQDVRTLAELMRNLPEDLRGNFLNTFIRGLGKGQKDAFSPAIFSKEWGNLSPQTKTVLTGNSGPHMAALDDIATISKHFDEVHRRFGNPSGSGAFVNFAQSLKAIATGALTGTLAGPAAVVGGWLGGAGYAKFLSTPQGAASVAKFARRMQQLQNVPTIQNAAAARLAARNLRNTALATGIDAKIPINEKE